MFDSELALLSKIKNTMIKASVDPLFSEEERKNLDKDTETIINVQRIVMKYRTIIRHVKSDIKSEKE